MKRFVILMALSMTLAACGVKNDLIKPSGKPTSQDQHDPSKPPYPIGR